MGIDPLSAASNVVINSVDSAGRNIIDAAGGNDKIHISKVEDGGIGPVPMYKIAINGQAQYLTETQLKNSVIRGGKGDDQITVDPNVTIGLTIEGGDGNDVILGGSGDDRISGGRGNDWIGGKGGRDTIDGGRGNDHLFGGADGDVITGGKGNDFLSGGAGEDVLMGGAGDDTIQSGLGRDTVSGGAGINTLDNLTDLLNPDGTLNRDGTIDVVTPDSGLNIPM